MEKKLKKKIQEADRLLRKNKSIEAVLLLKKLVRNFPDFPYAHYLLGVARMKCGLFSLAKISFELANEKNPGNPENIRSLGWTKFMLGDIEKARSDLRDAINLDLTNATIYLDLAKTFFDRLNFDEGFAWIDRARNLDPRNKFISDNYEIAKRMKEDFFKLSEAEKEKIKKEKMTSEMQEQAHLYILKKVFSNRGFREEEMKELKNELDSSGLSEKMLIYKDHFENETKETILEKREEIEKSLSELIEQKKINISVARIKGIIYNEKDHNDIEKIVKEFDQNQELEEFKKILELINKAWNYFPHRSLKGLSPAEKVLEIKK